MTREQVVERARRAIPDFLRRRKPAPAPVPPANGGHQKKGKINWKYLFELAEKSEADEKGV